jgi:replicative DNA helicase
MTGRVETDNAGQVMTAANATDVLHGIEITVLRQMGDNLAAQTRSLDRLTEKVDDVRERVIRLESQKTHIEVAAIQKRMDNALERIDDLEAQQDRSAGAESVWTWLSKNAAWLFAGVAAFIAGLAIKGGFIK